MGIESSFRPWHSLTSLHCGKGTANLIECTTTAEVQEIIARYRDVKIIGGGTNTVGRDDDGSIVLRLTAPAAPIEIISASKGLVRIHCAASSGGSISRLAKLGLGGLAPLSGIPGSIGGAAAMNAGANNAEIADSIAEMTGVYLDSGKIWHWERSEGGFSYRTSPRPRQVLLTSVTLCLRQVETAVEEEAILRERQRRAKVTPAGYSAGSVFRNPPDSLPAGILLERAGCKELSSGNLKVSPQHANWIVNTSSQPAAAADAQRLINEMKRRVAEENGIELQCEWRFA